MEQGSGGDPSQGLGLEPSFWPCLEYLRFQTTQTCWHWKNWNPPSPTCFRWGTSTQELWIRLRWTVMNWQWICWRRGSPYSKISDNFWLVFNLSSTYLQLVFNLSSLKHGKSPWRSCTVHDMTWMTCIILQNPFSCQPRRCRRSALGELWVSGPLAVWRLHIVMKCLAWLSAVCRQRYCSYLELLSKICQLILRECMHAVTHCDTCIVHCWPLIIWIASDDCRALQSGDRGRAFGDGRFNWKQVLQGSASRVQSC